ncbi:MAG: bifunctional precorrin-2 dehydrogenase/sirohydrochlorin ferrochelatase [Rhodobacteraceae bacterium]|jgi:precorrin-2 dehydrogenase/sirohydrochlorin ferrochelatase|nr:bifunctional precorrin-2 dehydrogenase/sirohydrochlorin ferrochelatase [Paracoccaceae bacterium]
MTKKYPIFLDLKDKDVLIVGGGPACLEKLMGLADTEAKISIITKTLHSETSLFLEKNPGIGVEIREVSDQDLLSRDLIFFATENSETNKRLRSIAKSHKILSNAVDDPAHCDFFSSSLVNLGAVSFSISTDGKFAGVTSALRKLFEEIMPEGDIELFQKIYLMRKQLKEILPEPNERKAVLKEIIHNLETRYFRK